MLVEAGDLIGKVLLDAGYISPLQLEEARDRQAGCPGRRLGEILMELGYLSGVQLEKGWALQALERELQKRVRR